MPNIDTATQVVAIGVGLLLVFGAGLAVGSHDPATLRADRRARASAKGRGRHGLQPDTVQPDPDNTTIDEPTVELPIATGDLPGRTRFTNLYAGPAAPAKPRGQRLDTAEVRLLSHQILTAEGVPEIFAAVYGGRPADDDMPLFHETLAAVAEMPSPTAQIAAVIHQAALKQLDRESVPA